MPLIGTHALVGNSWAGTNGRLSCPKSLRLAAFVSGKKMKQAILVDKAAIFH